MNQGEALSKLIIRNTSELKKILFRSVADPDPDISKIPILIQKNPQSESTTLIHGIYAVLYQAYQHSKEKTCNID